MSALGERTLIQHLVDSDSLRTLAREGLPPECLPTEQLREVYEWVMDVYHRGGQTTAPSLGVIQFEWGDLLSDLGVEFDVAPEDSIEWAIDDLKGGYIFKEVSSFNKRLAADMAEATTNDRIEIVATYASELVGLSMELSSQESRVDASKGLMDRLLAYEGRASGTDGGISGLRFGLPMLDDYTRGIHPGELAVLAAGPKTGKSFILALFALKEWEAGRVPILFTLENSVEMTLDRIACLAQHVDYRLWQQGRLSIEDYDRVRMWGVGMRDRGIPFHVVQPEPGQRSIEMLVRQAQLYEADSLFIDQLTFVEPEDPHLPRPLQIRDMTHTLKSMISTGHRRMPCVIAHQINREGVKSADKVGHLEMYHLAESSEVERTADWVFGVYRSKEDTAALTAKFQTLASRREDLQHFRMVWDVGRGHILARSRWDIDR